MALQTRYTVTMKQSKVLISLSVICLVLGSVIGFLVVGSNTEENQPLTTDVACTEEARICPDGSGVARQGPNCEFPDCPSEMSAIKPQ